MTLRIRVYPDPILTRVSKPVTDFDNPALATLCLDLLRTMEVNAGIGLSAVQVGVLKRIIVMRVPNVSAQSYHFINPEILERSEEMFTFSEGCLSVPGFFDDRERHKKIKLQYQDVMGIVKVQEFEDIEAFCIQHEMDHLEGKLFIDDFSPLKKDRVRKKISKTLRQIKR